MPLPPPGWRVAAEPEPAPAPADPRTDAERRYDALLAERRAKGRATYGQGLDHRDARWDWPLMALEEAQDLSQYLTAELLRLEDRLRETQRALDSATVRTEAAELDREALEAKVAPLEGVADAAQELLATLEEEGIALMHATALRGALRRAEGEGR